MQRETTFVAERFTGVVVENLRVVPSEDGKQLGLTFVSPTGDDVSVVISSGLMPLLLESLERGIERCNQRIAASLPERFE